jgi:GNAT superfamily N-acetyltransferase
MDLPSGYQLRAPTPDDADAVAYVLADAGQTVLDADFLRDEWSRVGFDLSSDAWVVADGEGTIVAYGQALRDEPSIVEGWGIVHPTHRGRGIGASLMNRIEQRAPELVAGLPSVRFRHAIDADDRAAAAMLRARGLRRVRNFWHMRIDLVGPVQPGPGPTGIEITVIEAPDDLPAVHAVLDQAFADDWGHHPEPFHRWAEEQTTSPSYDPTLWLLATVGGEPVCALTANVWGDRGWVNEIGVLPSRRGCGIGSALLRRSFAMFARRELRSVFLNVDAENPTGATVLYERVGMRVVNRWELWEHSLVVSS